MIRTLLTVAVAGPLVALAACDTTRKVESSPPTVTYAYSDTADYDRIYERADRYCGEHYGADAVAVDRRRTNGGYETTFACE